MANLAIWSPTGGDQSAERLPAEQTFLLLLFRQRRLNQHFVIVVLSDLQFSTGGAPAEPQLIRESPENTFKRKNSPLFIAFHKIPKSTCWTFGSDLKQGGFKRRTKHLAGSTLCDITAGRFIELSLFYVVQAKFH